MESTKPLPPYKEQAAVISAQNSHKKNDGTVLKNVVADVVATRETTTEKKKPATTRKKYNWRIEINKRKKKDNGFTYHWIYRLTKENGKRKSKYGGSLDSLKMRNPERWESYKQNSKGV